MASEPPPPPNPHDSSFLKSSCAAAASPSFSRPALRRSRTLANPEQESRWRREPLTDITNDVLFERNGNGARLQRVPFLVLPPPPTPTQADATSSSPPTSPSPFQTTHFGPPPANRLRRSHTLASPSTSTFDASPSSPLAPPPRALPFLNLTAPARRRLLVPPPSPGIAVLEMPSTPTTRNGGGGGHTGQARRRARSATAESEMSENENTTTVNPSARGLPAVLEDEDSGRGELDNEEGRRLRRRRTSGFR